MLLEAHNDREVAKAYKLPLICASNGEVKQAVASLVAKALPLLVERGEKWEVSDVEKHSLPCQLAGNTSGWRETGGAVLTSKPTYHHVWKTVVRWSEASQLRANVQIDSVRAWLFAVVKRLENRSSSREVKDSRRVAF